MTPLGGTRSDRPNTAKSAEGPWSSTRPGRRWGMGQHELDSLTKEFCLDDERVHDCWIQIRRCILKRLVDSCQQRGKLQDYIFLRESGLGSHEARGTVWPEQLISEKKVGA